VAKKLTIEVDERLAERIEQIARRRRQSVSELTSSLYETLIASEIDENLAPITARYKGVLPNTEIDARRAATEYLAHKHG
jgi:predicted transcriptional regulator